MPAELVKFLIRSFNAACIAQKMKIAFYKCVLDLKMAAIAGSAFSIF
jgi:hypothetical protein